MKQTLSLFLALILTFSLCIGLISCGNTNNSNDDNSSGNNPDGDNPSANNPDGDNPSGNNPDGDNPSENNPFIVDLAGYVANIGNATALGISRKEKASASPMASYGRNNFGVQLLSFNTLASDKDTEDKNYIVMSTTDYDANAPEADKTGLTKVTFTKIVTENVTTETTGTKYIIANEGTISISATEGFKYTVYYNDSLVYNEVQDNDSNDKDSKIGVIVLDNLIDGIEYKVNYRGIGVETTITQDDINGEVDKLYVVNGYTFISFVPMGQSQRPNDGQMDYDSNGVAIYDKTNYFSNDSRQSFVIDNATGYVYQLKDFSIDLINAGLISSSGKYFDMNASETGELNFVQVVTNETLKIYNIFKDKFGNKYVRNDYLDIYDEENRTLYFTDTNHLYVLSEEGIAIHIVRDSCYIYSIPSCYAAVEKINEDFSATPISKTDSFVLNYAGISHISEGYIYASTYNTFYRADLTQKMMYEGRLRYVNEWKRFDNSIFIDFNSVLVLYEENGTTKVFYGEVWGENAIEYYGGENAKLILEDCTYISESGYDLNSVRFRRTTLTETIFYKIILDENGEPQAINAETYISPPQEVHTLYPLNK